MLVDSHCHLNLLDPGLFDNDIKNAVKQAEDNGVSHFLNVAVSIKDFPELLATAKQYKNVTASVGLHPNYDNESVDYDTLVDLSKDARVVAIGETGLDYFRSTGDLDWQRERFATHISAAKTVHKPLIIHTRDAKADTIKLMKEHDAAAVSGVMHCFTEDWVMAKQALDLGFYISFSGIVTFNSAKDLQDVAKQVPLDRMLVETDCPYLAPVPFRGKPNQPAYVRHTAEFIATLRGVAFETIAESTTENFFNLFKGAKEYV